MSARNIAISILAVGFASHADAQSDPYPSVPPAKFVVTEARPELGQCAAAVVSALNFAAERGFRFELVQSTWRVTQTNGKAPVDDIAKQISGSLKSCPALQAELGAQARDPKRYFESLLRSVKLSVQLNPAGEIQYDSAPSTGQPVGNPAASVVNTDVGDRATAQAPALEKRIDSLEKNIGDLLAQLTNIASSLNLLHDDLSSLPNPPPSSASFLQFLMTCLSFAASTVTLIAISRVARVRTEQATRGLESNVVKGAQQSQEGDPKALAAVQAVQYQLQRVESVLAALRSEVRQLRPIDLQADPSERIVQPQVRATPSIQREYQAPLSTGTGNRRPNTGEEWSVAYNEALTSQGLEKFAVYYGGAWTQILDRSAWPAQLIRVDRPPQRGILDGFLYIRDRDSRGGWVFPGPNFYTARSAISTGQLRLEAFNGIFEARPGDTYALRRPAKAVETRTEISIEQPGTVEL
jgi:hypothetical protein